jgi:hypothetical protein
MCANTSFKIVCVSGVVAAISTTNYVDPKQLVSPSLTIPFALLQLPLKTIRVSDEAKKQKAKPLGLAFVGGIRYRIKDAYT